MLISMKSGSKLSIWVGVSVYSFSVFVRIVADAHLIFCMYFFSCWAFLVEFWNRDLLKFEIINSNADNMRHGGFTSSKNLIVVGVSSNISCLLWRLEKCSWSWASGEEF